MLDSVSRTKYSPPFSEQLPCTRMFANESYPAVILVPYSKAPYEESFEIMTPNSQGNHRVWKPFEHYKRSIGILDSAMSRRLRPVYGSQTRPYWAELSYPYYLYNDTAVFGRCDKLDKDFNSYLLHLYLPRADGGFVPAPSNLDDLMQASLNSMLPKIKSQLSLINSIIELKDFKTLPNTLRTINSVLVKSKVTLREAFRAKADGYLQAKFNILPLLSDISGIKTALLRTEKRMNDLVTRTGRTQRMHFAFKWHEATDVAETAVGDCVDDMTGSFLSVGLSNPIAVTTKRFVYHDPTIFHAEIEYNFNFTQYQIEHARILALLDALGVNLNPAIIWNAIPWSFVVDWVFGVSRWLNQFKLSNMEPQINIHRYLWSVKRSRRILVTCYQTQTGSPAKLPAATLPLPVVYEEAYRRFAGLPTRSSITLSGLSLVECSLGAALVIARRRHRKQRGR
jgi:hypothetical protein